MKNRLYARPEVVVKNSKLRISLLAGSDGVFNGVSGGTIEKPSGMQINGSRTRNATNNM